MSDTLKQICADKREHVRKRMRERPESRLLEEAAQAPAPRGFIRSLKQKAESGYALIAEIKKASPSKGVIRADFNPPKLAEAYEKGGAACLSVLTDTPYFQGEDAYLEATREACALPALRKDFMLEPYQIIESRALGADAVLLIMAALGDTQAEELYACARSLSLDVLVEVHDERELERACGRLEPELLGVNNRDLKSFSIDLAVSERLRPLMPPQTFAVSESGIFTHDDLKRLEMSGYRGFLVGESLMRQEDVEAATRKLLEG